MTRAISRLANRPWHPRIEQISRTLADSIATNWQAFDAVESGRGRVRRASADIPNSMKTPMQTIRVEKSSTRECDTCGNERVHFTYAVQLGEAQYKLLCTNCVDVLRKGILSAKRGEDRPAALHRRHLPD
ncbi:MAG: hypothetical protein ACI80V_002864 [Rhodothermales bacterium]|jgi:hypothetical protein